MRTMMMNMMSDMRLKTMMKMLTTLRFQLLLGGPSTRDWQGSMLALRFSLEQAVMEKPYRSTSMYHKESSLTTITIIENRNEVGLLGEWNDPASVEPYSYAGFAITSGK